MKRYLLSLFLLAAVPYFAYSQRTVRTINESWQFHKGELQDPFAVTEGTFAETVSIPHTWNASDSWDEVPGYYRGIGFYRKNVAINDSLEGKRAYIRFEGANQEAGLYVNGSLAGTHKGGYTAFCFDITDYVHSGENTFVVKVDNSYNEQIPPLSADFTFFGGIYRDVYLMITEDTHISVTHYATDGVYLSTPSVDSTSAEVEIRTMVTNAGSTKEAVTVEHRIVAPDGQTVSTLRGKMKIKGSTVNEENLQTVTIDNPALWDIDSPQLYKVYTTLQDRDGRVLDRVSSSFGIRWYSFDPDEGFYLNGKYRKLMGTNRHQDYSRLGNALRDEMHVRDIRLLKEMGGNFLRIAHYPQDPVITQMCDREGIVTSIEIPVVNAVTMTEEFEENCITMTKEMVWQSYNSPSVIMWAYMNEVLLRPPYDKNNETEKRTYLDYVYKIASGIENTIRELDKERYTMLPCHSNPGLYAECGIAALPKILGWNLYNGWYSNGFDGFARQLDKIHSMFPRQSILVTEYGADVDPRLHSFDSERFDFTCEYGLKYHHHYIPAILERKWLAGTTIWNLNDFYSEARRDAVPNVNNKGITGVDREIKDSYWLYQSVLSEDPVLRIGGSGWKVRGGLDAGDGRCVQPVEVYSNADQVELCHNGTSLGKRRTENGTAYFSVPFTDGQNILSAAAEKDGVPMYDMLRIDFRLTPSDAGADSFTELNVMLGSKRYFEDRAAGMVWIPEKEYVQGSWGYTGGEAARTKTRHGSLPASDVDVLGTDQDPVFQTQRKGIESFRADVPDGYYYVYLYFADLESGKDKAALAYNLGNDVIRNEKSDRIFDVSINGQPVLKEFDIAKECGYERAVIKKFPVVVTGDGGLSVDFTPVKGEPVLNAVRIYRCY